MLRLLSISLCLILVAGCQLDFSMWVGTFEEEEEAQSLYFPLNKALKVESNDSLTGTWLVASERKATAFVDEPEVFHDVLSQLDTLKMVFIEENPLDEKNISIYECEPTEREKVVDLNAEDKATGTGPSGDYVWQFDDHNTLAFDSEKIDAGVVETATWRGIKVSHQINDRSLVESLVSEFNFNLDFANHDGVEFMNPADDYAPICFRVRQQHYSAESITGAVGAESVSENSTDKQVIELNVQSAAGDYVYLYNDNEDKREFSSEQLPMPTESGLTQTQNVLVLTAYDAMALRLFDERYFIIDGVYDDLTPHPDNRVEYIQTDFQFDKGYFHVDAESVRPNDEFSLQFDLRL
ncbi:MAG: hypothetical protein OXE99_11530 [Cellvibrionales bacterium]|nr:hypothetical protein [Cellvibrionales bacterium]